jgi:hypothetical protein
MTDWWQFTADWDAAVLGNLGLYGEPVPPWARGDIGGDGRSDILMNGSRASLRFWLMDGAEVLETVSVPGPTTLDWVVEGSGDFDADGRNDILWRNSYSGVTSIWFMDETGIREELATEVLHDNRWQVAGVGDFDGDDRADILWIDPFGDPTIWLMEGTAVDVADSPARAPRRYEVVGVADFDGDGRDDILWRSTISGGVRLWLMEGTGVRGQLSLAPWVHSSWRVAGLGDLNGDDRTDVLWRHTRGLTFAWLMGESGVDSSGWLPRVSRTWIIAGLGDFDGDGRDDLAWRRQRAGDTYVWFMDGTTVTGGDYTSEQLDETWTIVSPWALAQPPERLDGSPSAASSPSRRSR